MGTPSVIFVANNTSGANWLPGTPTIDHGALSPSTPPNVSTQGGPQNLFTAEPNWGLMGDEGAVTYSCGASPSTDQFVLWWDNRWSHASGPGVIAKSANYDISSTVSFSQGSGNYTVTVSLAPKTAKR
ncbi:hypothetical protein HRD49_06965 [Corallococcus exiguus]|uniref:hypothetical protein n=1 Tax=Corallococcus TaxID=83461 RepID=UPI000EA40996|nr:MULTISPECIES: hypothetical protein [Corallococcus]RKI51085.1 hypothetical protein D7Y27_00010 [Corallococcus sp. AB004]NNB84267.1 hypothetical protein [Corallococcus exiguus]NNC06134.1 hypothetical protein [Corallococcus exiguus]NPC76217.1 hypothetical protein [Corallococcus exiguus]NPD22617.1 hypothetical protein [Corallococcus exiguus]